MIVQNYEKDFIEIKAYTIVYVFYGASHMRITGNPVFAQQSGSAVFHTVEAGEQGAGECGVY